MCARVSGEGKYICMSECSLVCICIYIYTVYTCVRVDNFWAVLLIKIMNSFTRKKKKEMSCDLLWSHFWIKMCLGEFFFSVDKRLATILERRFYYWWDLCKVNVVVILRLSLTDVRNLLLPFCRRQCTLSLFCSCFPAVDESLHLAPWWWEVSTSCFEWRTDTDTRH